MMDRAQHEQQHQRNLQHGEESEPGAVANDDLQPANRRGQQSLERATDAFAQEADAGQDEDQKEDDEADQGRRERVEEGPDPGCRWSADR